MSDASCVWVTGASSGIGAAFAVKLAKAGRKVVISARRADALAEIAAQSANISCVTLDITDHAAVRAAVVRIEAEFGPIGLAVLNAGTYWPTPAQSFDADNVLKMLDVNFNGTLYCLESLLPPMLARQSGHIAVVSSVAGYRGLPTAAGYAAGKAALIALCESLRLDLLSSHIKIQVINPGFVETPLTAKNDFPMPDIITADRAAELMVAGLASDNFTISFPRRFAFFMRLLRIMPDRLFFWLAAKTIPKPAAK